jgi:hypothetical protein
MWQSPESTILATAHVTVNPPSCMNSAVVFQITATFPRRLQNLLFVGQVTSTESPWSCSQWLSAGSLVWNTVGEPFGENVACLAFFIVRKFIFQGWKILIGIATNHTQFWLLFCMGVKLGLSYWERNIDWRCLRIGCGGRYLGLRGMRQRGISEDYITKSFMICTAHQILFGLSNQEGWDNVLIKRGSCCLVAAYTILTVCNEYKI